MVHGVDLKGVSGAARVGVGYITDGEILDFNSPFPHGTTRLIGGELTLDFESLLEGKPIGRMGQLALMYYWGHIEESFDQDDLPLGEGGLLSLIEFSSTRNSDTHYLLTEWRWPTFTPVFASKHWSLIDPEFGLGFGGLYVKTRMQEGDADPVSTEQFAFVMTGSTRVRVVTFRVGNFEASLEGAVRIFAGQVFGLIGEAGLFIGYINTHEPAEPAVQAQTAVQPEPLNGK